MPIANARMHCFSGDSQCPRAVITPYPMAFLPNQTNFPEPGDALPHALQNAEVIRKQGVKAG